mmetsp:Transcript_1352/g.1820  ORF Transcript_1352/g.1820 Transcript_1352/m.1820 type:complete len:336 (+) Transcript_1352:116-1123(+)|eukprot:CAMPEP_0117762918 /NCGR_PEP_ID=MMETSP0947-20121206/18282_1 /TAXON_ID=44440 /ORGANISM="Chattonella subsalsa, Strain CCMP2191" /LENGTH=335 /DNA_ID=CAMNT_0005584433 /DNA_START=57 /DNA_END=1064 /DNA_ORIENTATION=+
MAAHDGCFSKPSYVSVNDPYISKRPQTVHKEQNERRNFTTSPPKFGQTASTLGPGPIDFKPAYVNDPYIDSYKLHARERMKNKAKFRTPNGFGYSSPMKKSSSTGDFYGSFTDQKTREYKSSGPPLPHNHMHLNFKKGSERNFLTQPSKRGGPGYSHRGFANTEISYKSEPYDEDKRIRRKERLQHIKAVGERKPFVSTAKRVDMFDAQEHAAVSKVFSEDGACLPVRKPSSEGLTPIQYTEKNRAKTATGIFRPSSPPKLGTMASTFTGFPDHMPEPFDEKITRQAKLPDRLKPHAVQVSRLPEALQERKPFIPPTVPKSGLMKSTAKMGLHVK